MGKKEKLREQLAELPGGVNVLKTVATRDTVADAVPPHETPLTTPSSEVAAWLGCSQSSPGLTELLGSIYHFHQIWKISL